jgi:hypothetical protein
VEQLYDSMHSAVQAARPAAGADNSTDGWAAQVGRTSLLVSCDNHTDPLVKQPLAVILTLSIVCLLCLPTAAQAAAQLAPLAPEAFFAPGGAAGCTTPFIIRDQVRSHEAALKAELLRWACECGEEGRAAAGAALGTIAATCYQEAPEHSARLQVCTNLAGCGCMRAGRERKRSKGEKQGSWRECSSPLVAQFKVAHARAHQHIPSLSCPSLPSPPLSRCLQDGQALVGLLLDLLAQDLLPAIVFSFERSACHYLAEAVVQYLEVGACMQGLVGGGACPSPCTPACVVVCLAACMWACLAGLPV